MNGWIYAAVVVAIGGAAVGAAAGILVFRRVLATPHERRPVLAWLLLCLAAMAVAQIAEQGRVLTFRLSFDGVIDRGLFARLYDATWNVTVSKLLGATAMTTAAAIKVAIWRRLPDEQVVCWALRAAAATVAVWFVLAVVLETVLE